MKNFLFLILLAFASSAQAANKKIECTLSEEVGLLAVEPLKVTAQLVAKEGEYADSKSLSRGEFAYSFVVEYLETELNVTIQENNSIQDEVGNFTCDIEKNGPFCKEPIFDTNGDHAFNFVCTFLK